ncbi:hypothetical protein EZ449_05900 [Pedobacter frigidisoli]|uniref:DoxX-like family protein n=1 Tax=Pedobacter frigidisoli TaxID=2530455 RepID=A0A4R0P6D8_9SPHI|nr:hypothetical protein [Pedobacter frigidisoli]TCD11032.1 hypothetical protein EZ449_05900 [Pedobacter frigidisoli]
MISRIISGILLLATVYFGVSHGSRVFQKPTQQYLEMMNALGISNPMRIAFSILSIGSALLILIPNTFFIGNAARAVLLVLMMALALKAGNYKFALIEIPFVMMPLILIYFGHPLKNTTFNF